MVCQQLFSNAIPGLPGSMCLKSVGRGRGQVVCQQLFSNAIKTKWRHRPGVIDALLTMADMSCLVARGKSDWTPG